MTTHGWIPEVTAVLRDRRARTRALVDALDDRAVHDQFVDFLSPVVWDLGHVGNFEELWLLRELGGRPPTDPDLDRLYNAFENPRWTRGELPLLDRDAAHAYLDDVRAEALADLERARAGDADDPRWRDGYVHRMIAQHESQHQETVLQALDLRPDLAPFEPAAPVPRPAPPAAVDDTDRVVVPAGPYRAGTDDRRWTYDNERPAHVVDVPAFTLDRFPATARRYAAFVADGGDDDPRWWSPRGWRWRCETGHDRPQGWVPDGDGGWRVRRFGFELALDPREIVQHLAFHEAEAFAAWAGGRLPTEFEWEKAAGWDPAAGRLRRYPWGDDPPTPRRANVGLVRFGPALAGSLPAGRSALGIEHAAGDVYEWTASPFAGYPGFQAFPYAEYSQVFFDGDHRVLRGSSWAIAGSLARVTYRNWDHPHRRQVFAGVRVARDA